MTRVLVVDDDSQIRDMLRMTLEREGYEVSEAADGNEAVSLFRAEEIDVVVTDIVMPEKEGIETIMDLKSIDPAVKIIAISGGGRINPEDYLKWARRFGVGYTFTKPVDRQALLAAVADLADMPVA